MLWVQIPSGQGNLIGSSTGRARKSKNPISFRDRSSNWSERQLVTLEAVGSNPIGPATNLWYLGEVAKHIGLSNRHSRVRISQVSLLENEEKRFQEIDFDSLEPLPYALFTPPLRSHGGQSSVDLLKPI